MAICLNYKNTFVKVKDYNCIKNDLLRNNKFVEKMSNMIKKDVYFEKKNVLIIKINADAYGYITIVLIFKMRLLIRGRSSLDCLIL